MLCNTVSIQQWINWSEFVGYPPRSAKNSLSKPINIWHAYCFIETVSFHHTLLSISNSSYEPKCTQKLPNVGSTPCALLTQDIVTIKLSFINITMCCHLSSEWRWSYLSETYATCLLAYGACCDFTCGQPFRALTHFPGPRTLQLSTWCPRMFHSLTTYTQIMLDWGTNTFLFIII